MSGIKAPKGQEILGQKKLHKAFIMARHAIRTKENCLNYSVATEIKYSFSFLRPDIARSILYLTPLHLTLCESDQIYRILGYK